jgi:hypothetical protein
MSAEIVKLVTKSDNCANWSPEQAVEEFLQEIKDGKTKPVKMIIMYFEEKENGNLKPHRWFANINRAEEIALTTLANHMAIEEWRD